jgi:hypothetical protein
VWRRKRGVDIAAVIGIFSTLNNVSYYYESQSIGAQDLHEMQDSAQEGKNTRGLSESKT